MSEPFRHTIPSVKATDDGNIVPTSLWTRGFKTCTIITLRRFTFCFPRSLTQSPYFSMRKQEAEWENSKTTIYSSKNEHEHVTDKQDNHKWKNASPKRKNDEIILKRTYSLRIFGAIYGFWWFAAWADHLLARLLLHFGFQLLALTGVGGDAFAFAFFAIVSCLRSSQYCLGGCCRDSLWHSRLGKHLFCLLAIGNRVRGHDFHGLWKRAGQFRYFQRQSDAAVCFWCLEASEMKLQCIFRCKSEEKLKIIEICCFAVHN